MRIITLTLIFATLAGTARAQTAPRAERPVVPQAASLALERLGVADARTSENRSVLRQTLYAVGGAAAGAWGGTPCRPQ